MRELLQRRVSPELSVGRETEALRLQAAILKRQSLLICGPPGVGKTLLLSEVLSELRPEVAQRCFYFAGIQGLQDLLRRLLRRLHESDPTLRRQLRNDGFPPTDFRGRLKTRSTSRLKGTLYRAVEKRDYWVFLDHMPPLSHAAAKVVKELVRMRNTPVFLLARGSTEKEVGHVTDLYGSERDRLPLGLLSERAAKELLERSIRRFELSQFDSARFREEILRLSGHVPGAIVKMCALAAEPRYQYGSQIKTKLVHIDYLMGGHALVSSRHRPERNFQR